MKLGIWIILGLFISCQKVNIPQKDVVKKLTIYGKRNPENLILISTTFGDIKLKLFEETPLHRANFIRLIKYNVFDGQKIYRIVKGLCIQGGLFPDSLKYKIPSEILSTKKHKVGSLSMASWSTKMTPPTEFFIITKLNEKYNKLLNEPKEFLDNEFTVFGEVIEGQEVVDKISEQDVKNIDQPVNVIKFSISILKN